MDDTNAHHLTVVPPADRSETAAEICRLVPSAEPAVVFTSLARLCVPLFSDACTVDIIEGSTSYRISQPPGHDDATSPLPSDLRTIHSRFESPEMTHGGAYAGVIVHAWRTHEPTSTDIAHAEVLAQLAVTIINFERAISRYSRDDPDPVETANKRPAHQRSHRGEAHDRPPRT